MEMETNTEDLLSLESNLVRAEHGKRFLNYLIDVIFFYVLIFTIIFIIAIVSPSALAGLADDDGGLSLTDQLVSLLFYALYMSIVEAVFKGKSLGKLITGTRAVYEDGRRISTSTAFARGLSRAVPFCVFSAFGSPCIPWQDKWTNTMVVDEKKSAQL